MGTVESYGSRLDDSRAGPNRSRTVSNFPYINKPAALCEFDEMGEVTIIYHILCPIGCLLLHRLHVVIGFVPLVGFPVAGLLIDDMPFGEAVIIGVDIALAMLAFNLLALRRTKHPMWEGVVVNKYSKEKYKHRDEPETYTEYTTVINTDAGRKKTIVEVDSRRHMCDNLSVGDRVRYHPMFGTYEKYGKSKDRIIYCNVCTVMNPIQNDRCKWCNNLLFK